MKNILTRRKIALYDPYLAILGGGEKHILSILKALENKYEINIFWDKDLEKEIKQKFSLQFINKLKWLPNIFKKKGNSFEKFMILKKIDLFFYVTDGSYFFSAAKKNFVFCMMPKKDLYQMSFFNRLKTLNFRFISNSHFTHLWLKKWGIENNYIYPYIDDEFFHFDLKKLKKEKIILSVGRFFEHLHAKRQDFIIKTFNKLQHIHEEFKDFRLYLIGGLDEQDKYYLKKLKFLAQNNKNIIFLINVSYTTLLEYYKKSLFYWHAAGYNIDEIKHPELTEHLGISPLEAMASGCITCCYKAGGPKEIIHDGKNGFFFNDEKELIKKMISIVNDETLRQNIQNEARKNILSNFNYQHFSKTVKKEIL